MEMRVFSLAVFPDHYNWRLLPATLIPYTRIYARNDSLLVGRPWSGHMEWGWQHNGQERWPAEEARGDGAWEEDNNVDPEELF